MTSAAYARRIALMDEARRVCWESWRRIADPKNAAKGGWDSAPTWRLVLMLLEEACELAWEALRGRRGRALVEAGDLLTVAAMLTERSGRRT